MNISLRDSNIHPADLDFLENHAHQPNLESRQDPPHNLQLAAIDIRTDHLPTFANRIVLSLDCIDKENSEEAISTDDSSIFSKTAQRSGKLAVFLFLATVIFLGQYATLNPQVTCIQDAVLDNLKFANDFINNPGNEGYRFFFQCLCSCFVDVSFILTFGFWVLHGSTCRLPISLGLFYLVRALVQALWFSPFPSGFYWSDPGIPSLVVPYGRGSDFFFSGHSGFMLICALEWHIHGKTKIRNALFFFTAYTVLILLVYRIHYSIDVFVGLFFSDWCFWKIDKVREKIDIWWINIFIDLRIFMKRFNNEDKVTLIR